MAVIIEPTGDVTVRLAFPTPQLVKYLARVVEPPSTELEKYIGDNQNAHQQDHTLTTSPAKLDGAFVDVFLSIADADAGQSYSVSVELLQNQVLLKTETFTGTTAQEPIDHLFTETLQVRDAS
jgi:hypothetical protein